MLKILSIVLTGLCMLSLQSALADSSTTSRTIAVSTHDITQNDADQYLLGATDPYFIFNLDINKHSNATGLQFSIEKPVGKSIDLEIFFKNLASESAPSFDPLSHLKLTVPEDHISPINIALPKEVIDNFGSLLRIDIDRCGGCLIDIQSAPQLVPEFKPEATLMTIKHLFNGGQTVSEQGFELNLESGLESSLGNWQFNDIEANASSLELVGNDPYLVSPLINLRTSNLGGVKFSLTPPEKLNKPVDFQLFYQTETHRFIETRSTRWRSHITTSGLIEAIIPLDYLSKQHPRQNLLKRIRLDFELPSLTPGLWLLNKVEFLSHQQMSESRSLIPARITTIKSQRPSGFQLLKNSLQKISHDLGFTISYLLLLLLTAFGFWRSFKR